jgi:hypothetical protein
VNDGKIVAINIETGMFEIADDLMTASKSLSARLPDAQTWFVRIGHQAVDHFGAPSFKKSHDARACQSKNFRSKLDLSVKLTVGNLLFQSLK